MALGRWSLGLWLAAAIAAGGCRSQDKPARRSTLDFAPPRLDLGVLVENRPVRSNVDLHNPGAREVPIRQVSSSARCEWHGIPATLAPRTTARLSVVCQSDLLGPFEESLTVLDVAQGGALATLQIDGKVEPLIGFDTAHVDLRPEFGQTVSADAHLIGTQAAAASPRVTSTGGDLVTAVLLPSDGGNPQGVRVSCQGRRVGMHAGSTVVDTGVAARPTLTLSWGCRVPATLEVDPSTPYFNLRASGDRAMQIRVRSSQPGFLVKAARIVEGPFRATLEKPTPDGSTPITIRVDNDAIPDDARSATGKLLIESNDQREPRREVPLFGFGKVNKVAVPAASP